MKNSGAPIGGEAFQTAEHRSLLPYVPAAPMDHRPAFTELDSGAPPELTTARRPPLPAAAARMAANTSPAVGWRSRFTRVSAKAASGALYLAALNLTSGIPQSRSLNSLPSRSCPPSPSPDRLAAAPMAMRLRGGDR